MSLRITCNDPRDPAERDRGVRLAVEAAGRGDLVVLPTETVYGLGCDAFRADGVARLLAAKGRGRDLPLPVLIGSSRTLAGLTGWVTADGERLAEAFWPGPLTLVVRQAASLAWDLGDSRGTVSVRMPLHPLALDVLRAVGPMAVTGAGRAGEPLAATCDEAEAAHGDAVQVYLDAGPCAGLVPSTVVDVTTPFPRMLREGAISLEQLRAVAPDVEAVR